MGEFDAGMVDSALTRGRLGHVRGTESDAFWTHGSGKGLRRFDTNLPNEAHRRLRESQALTLSAI